jgi:hypothetical protein
LELPAPHVCAGIKGEKRLNDKVFFPIAILFATLVIVGALSIERDIYPEGPIGGAASGDYAVIPITGLDFHRIEGLNQEVTARIRRNVLTLTTRSRQQQDDPILGPHFKLDSDIEVAFSGQTVRSYIQARSASGANLEVIYSTGEFGDSGWKRFELTDEWTSFRFDYNAPPRSDGDPIGIDYFGIRAVGGTLPAIVEIREIEFRRLGEWSR